MIVSHPILYLETPDEEIRECAEKEGYDKYVPVGFVRHLMAAFSFYKFGKNPSECIEMETPYTQQFRKVISMIKFDEVKTNHPVIFAIRVLKIIGSRFNLRKVEQSSLTGCNFDIAFTGCFPNYITDLTLLTPLQRAELGLPFVEDVTTSILSAQDELVLFHYNKLEFLEKTIDPVYVTTKLQLKSYSDFYRGRKYKLSLPSFSLDLGLKKLQITKVEDRDQFTQKIVLVLDCSLAMTQIPNALELLRSVILYYIGKMETIPTLTLTIVRMVGEVHEVEEITSVEQLTNLSLTFVLPIKSSSKCLSDLCYMYPGKSVVLVTSARFKMEKPLDINYKLYALTTNENTSLQTTCILSGGNYVTIKQ